MNKRTVSVRLDPEEARRLEKSASLTGQSRGLSSRRQGARWHTARCFPQDGSGGSRGGKVRRSGLIQGQARLPREKQLSRLVDLNLEVKRLEAEMAEVERHLWSAGR